MSLQLPPPFPARPVRRALLETLSEIDHSGAAIDRAPAFAYVPPSHTRALDPDNSVVEGIRGAGKSFWWETLHSEPHRTFISRAFPDARIGKNVLIAQGFGAQISSDEAPSKDVLAQLVHQFDPRAIWRAVVAKQAGFNEPFPQQNNWLTRVGWTKENPEAYDALLQQTDATLFDSGQTRLILFDALDQLADDWPSIRPLARALFQLALDLRASRRIRLKLFVRPDMLDDREITSFQDASKLLARKATLTWRRADLYALLFQYLGNAQQGGSEFRHHGLITFGLNWRQEEGGWLLPAQLRTDETLQEPVFIAIAGAAMASGSSGHKRGKPYTWLVNHLQDGRDQVSPRSFIAALRQAAADTEEMAADTAHALSYRAIQQGGAGSIENSRRGDHGRLSLGRNADAPLAWPAHRAMPD